jgi:hypothetical protein
MGTFVADSHSLEILESRLRITDRRSKDLNNLESRICLLIYGGA